MSSPTNIWVTVPAKAVSGENLGEVVPVRYDHFVKMLFKEESFRHMVDHARGGVCEEAGELSTALKRHVVYGTPLDTVMKDGQTILENIKEELGDLKFFTQAVMNLFGFSDQEIHQGNADKLSTRYANLQYSQEAAQNRADKL